MVSQTLMLMCLVRGFTSTELCQILAPLDGAILVGPIYLSITLASMMLQYTDPEVYGQNNMEASVCEGYVHCTEEYRTWNRTSRCTYNLCTFDGKTEQKSSLHRVKVVVHVLNSYSDYYRINLQALLLKSSSDWKCYLNDCSYKSIFTHFFFNNSQ